MVLTADDFKPCQDICFGIVYTIELIVKLVGFKLRFFKESWDAGLSALNYGFYESIF